MKLYKNKWKKLIAMLLCITNICGQVAPAMAQENVVSVAENMNDVLSLQEDNSTQNLALGKTAVASSKEADSVSAANAVDGNTSEKNSRWGSNRGNGPEWIYVDLGEPKSIKTVAIYWENRKATNYEIQVAETLSESMQETDWRTVKAFQQRPEKVTEKIVFEEEQNARYVRLLINSFTADDPDGRTEWNTISIYEMEVYGSEVEIEEQDPAVNIALGKTAVADGVENGTDFTAAKVVDGNITDNNARWSSEEGNGPHWVYVDLGKSMDVKGIRIFWETRKATKYKIQIADVSGDTVQENDWKDAKVLTQRPAKKTDIINLDGIKRVRYVRLYIENFDSVNPDNNKPWNTISVYEIEIYGGNAPGDPMDTSKINFVQPQKGDEKLQLIFPEVEGATISYNGTDYEQLVDDELKIYEPVVDSVAKVSVKVVNDEDPSEYVFKEMEVTIPGTYTVEEGDNPAPNVLPELREWKGAEEGIYEISENTRIVYKEDIFKSAAEALAKDYKTLSGNTLTVVQADEAQEGDIFFKATTGKGLFKEGYILDIGTKVVVEAEEYTGAYWATRTILQSIKSNGYIPQGIARDYPLYEVRGFILDVGRKTFTMDYLKQVVQEMAWYKLNDFQVHLNDNYIWLEDYDGEEAMTAYSGFRLETDIKKGGNGGLNQAELTSTDVFYTKADFRDLIQDARNYGVNIVPEIDVPAHSLALTKVRPDLKRGTEGIENDHLDLTNKFDESVEFVQSIFDEYMGKGLTNPVFDMDTVVHIGCDEYKTDATAFRNFCNSMIDYVQGNGRTVRFWGGLTWSKAPVEVRSKDVQINLWSKDWSEMAEMYESGYKMINCLDNEYYIVPNAGYYFDYLPDENVYNKPINTNTGVTIPAGDEQMLGGAFAVWNDMTDRRDNGVSEYDVYDRIKKPIALFGAKLWGKHDLSLEDAVARSEKLGSAPGNNFGYEAEDKEGVIAHYPMEDLGELSEVNAEITEVDGKNALKLNGNESYVKTELTTVGLENDLRVKVKRTSTSKKEQILFESPYGSIKAVQTGTGKVGFTRENYDYSFNYTLPVNEWVELEFKNAQNVIQLYVNGKLVDTLGDGEQIVGRPLLATMMFPIEKIGSETNAFIGYVDNVRLGVAGTYPSTMELDCALMIANQVLSIQEENETLTNLIAEGKALLKAFAPEETAITTLVTSIESELEKVEYEKADYTNVNAYLALVPKDLSVYTEESANALQDVVASIRTYLSKNMQKTVDGYEKELKKALKNLVLIEEFDVNFIAKNELKAVTASSYEEGEGPEKAMDGNTSTLWHSDYDLTSDSEGYHWIQFEFKDENMVPVSELIYVPRSDAGNGNFTGFEVLTSADGTEFTSVTSGNWDDNANEKVVTFTEPVTAKYIRLSATTYENGFGSAAEIKLRRANVIVDIDGLAALIDTAKVIEAQKDKYTVESWTVLEGILGQAEELKEKSDATANEVEGMKRELSAKIAGMRLKDTGNDIALSGDISKIYDGLLVNPNKLIVDKKDIEGEVSYIFYTEESCISPLAGIPKDAGTYWVKAFIEEASSNAISFTIEKAEIAIADITLDTTGLKDMVEPSVSVKEVNFTGLVNGERLEPGVDYVTSSTVDELQETTATITSIITLKDSVNNYVLKENTKAVNLEICKVTFETGEEATKVASVLVAKGDKVSKPAEPKKDGYDFAGWWLLGTGEETEDVAYDFENTPVTAPITITAKWKLNYGEITEPDRKEVEGEEKIENMIWVAGLDEDGYTYKGGKLTPDFRVYDENRMLIEGVDYTVSYKNNTNVYQCEDADGKDMWNTYLNAANGVETAVNAVDKNTLKKFKSKAPQFTLKMKGIYTGSKTVYFKINPVSINGEDFVTDNLIVSTVKKTQVPAIALLWESMGRTLKQNKEFTVEVKDVTGNKVDLSEEGDYTLTLKGTGNFTGELTKVNFKVVASTALSKLKVKVKKVTWTDKIATMENLDFAKLVLKEVKNGNTKLELGSENCPLEVVEVTNKTAVGTGSLTLAAKEGQTDYVGTRVITYNITGTPMSKVDVKNIDKKGYTFTGRKIDPLVLTADQNNGKVVEVINKATRKELVRSVETSEGNEGVRGHYNVEFVNNTNKGKATMVLTGNPEMGYTGTKKVTFKIIAAELNKTEYKVAVAENVEYTTGGATPEVVVTRTQDGETITLEKGVDYTVSYKNNKKVLNKTTVEKKKAPTVTVKGKGNYAKSLDENFTIVEKMLTTDNVRLVVTDKEYKKGKTNWKQKFYVVDENNKPISSTAYTAKYTVSEVVEGTTTEYNLSEKAKELPANSEVKLTVTFKDTSEYNSENLTIDKTFRILVKGFDVSKAKVKIKKGKALPYTGKPITLTSEDFAGTKLNGEEITSDNFDIIFDVENIIYENNTNIGTAKVTLRGNAVNGYGGEKTVTFKIGKRSIVDSWWKDFMNKE